MVPTAISKRLFAGIALALGALAAAPAFVGCAAGGPARAAEAPAPDPEKGPRLYVFECGEINVLDDAVFHPGIGAGVARRLADSCYLIVHPKGTLAWDTGLRDELAKVPGGVTEEKIFVMTVKKTLASQYQAVGVAPGAVNYLGLSHMHGDHIGNVGLFSGATLLMQKEEYESAFGPDAAKYGNDPAEYPTLASNPAKKLEGDFDVFGDGTVVVKRAIGHTPGHQTLFVRLPKTGNVLLSGDLVHFADNWKWRGVPAWNFDKERSLEAMREAERFLAANRATLWIQHDYEQSASLRHAPAYYE